MSEDEARTHIEKLIWPNGAICAYCSSKDVYKMEGQSVRAGLYRCRDCDQQFSVTVNTVLHDTHLPLEKWIKAFHLMASSKKGISALQLQRQLGIGQYRTAWHLAHRIRLAMTCEPFAQKLSGTLEVDETYVGGKVRGQGCKAGWDNKTPVVSLVERGGKKRSFVMPKVTAKNLRAAVMDHVEAGAHIHTDEHKGYKNLKDGFKHGSVNHSAGQYVRRFKDGSHITTNSVESSFALLKRGIMGSFHHVSRKHLHRYTAEFDFRWNERDAMDSERRDTAISKAGGKRLPY